jgi:hypothetical protein
MKAALNNAEARHILFCIAGELLCDPYELLELAPDLTARIFNGEDYATLLAYANENC